VPDLEEGESMGGGWRSHNASMSSCMPPKGDENGGSGEGESFSGREKRTWRVADSLFHL